MEKRNKKRQESGLEPEDKENLEAAFNRNLKRLNDKKQEIKEEKEFQRKKIKYTKAYEQKQINDLKQGKGTLYRNSKAWQYKNNKTRKKSPLSQVHHTPTDAFTPEERKRLTQLYLIDKESESKNADWGKISGGKRRKKRKTRKNRKKKTKKTRKRRRRRRSRKRRKTRRKRAGNKIHQN